jgi:hypothetical protein
VETLQQQKNCKASSSMERLYQFEKQQVFFAWCIRHWASSVMKFIQTKIIFLKE